MAINLDRNNEFRKVKPEAKSDSLMTINRDRNDEFEGRILNKLDLYLD